MRPLSTLHEGGEADGLKFLQQQVNAPPVIGKALDAVTHAQFRNLARHVAVIHRAAGRRFNESLLCPHVIGIAVTHCMLLQCVARLPEPALGAVCVAVCRDTQQCRQVIAGREIKAEIDFLLIFKIEFRQARPPLIAGDQRGLRIYPLVEIEVAELGFFRWHALGLVGHRLEIIEVTKRAQRRIGQPPHALVKNILAVIGYCIEVRDDCRTVSVEAVIDQQRQDVLRVR